MKFERKIAQTMIGKYVLASVNHYDADGTATSSEQIHGKILRVTEDKGVVVLLSNGSEFPLPPLLSCYLPAEEGIHTLKSTKEGINSPDYVATFNVTPTQDHE